MPDWTGRRFSSYFAYHSPDFLYRSATIDFRYKGLPGFAFGRFYSAPGFGPDDAEIFYISRSIGRSTLHTDGVSQQSQQTGGISAIRQIRRESAVGPSHH